MDSDSNRDNGMHLNLPSDQELISVARAAIELHTSRHRVLVAIALEAVALREIGGSYMFRVMDLGRVRARLEYASPAPVSA